jgi:hypothetical protein
MVSNKFAPISIIGIAADTLCSTDAAADFPPLFGFVAAGVLPFFAVADGRATSVSFFSFDGLTDARVACFPSSLGIDDIENFGVFAT